MAGIVHEQAPMAAEARWAAASASAAALFAAAIFAASAVEGGSEFDPVASIGAFETTSF